MSVKVPRAPRAEDAPAALDRIKELRARVLSKSRSPRGRESLSFGPAICVFAGTGLLFLAAALFVELMPSSTFAQLLVMFCARLPFGG